MDVPFECLRDHRSVVKCWVPTKNLGGGIGKGATRRSMLTQVLKRIQTLRASGVFYFCLGGHHDGVGRVGLGPPVGFPPLFTLEFSQQKKNFSAEITMSTLPK